MLGATSASPSTSSRPPARKNHERVVAGDLPASCCEKGDIYKDDQRCSSTDAQARRFLPDRYVEGTCPRCGYEGARGDQCDNCGSTLDAIDLINPRCRFDGTTPELRETEHFFLRSRAFNEPLHEWLSTDKEHWRPHVLNFTLGLLKRGPARPRDHARPRLGRPDPGRRLRRRQAHLRLVRGRHRLPVGREGVGADSRARPRPGATSGKTRPRRPTTSSARTTSVFHTIIWPAHG